MESRHIGPGGSQIGMFNLLDEEQGVIVSGNYTLLSFIGARISGGPFVASYNSTAKLFFLSGATFPQGVDISKMTCGVLCAQGLGAKYVKLGNVTESADLSCVNVDGELDLGHQTYDSDLSLRYGIVGVLNFGNDPNSKMDLLDLRDARVKEVRGTFPAEIRRPFVDLETQIPDALRKYLVEKIRLSERS